MRYFTVEALPPISTIGFGMLAATPTNAGEVGDVLDMFVAAGGTLVDTAHTYGDGASDRALGHWLATHDRDSVVILAKGGHPLADGRPRVTPGDLHADLDESLDRMATDHVDFFVLHRDDPSIHVGAILESTEAMLQSGKARAIGVSNWSVARIAEANEHAAAHGLTPFALNSPGMSLAEAREPMWPDCVYADDELVAFHTETRMPLAAWSAQARGFFSGRYRRGADMDDDMSRVYGSDENFDRLDRATELGRQRGFTANQVALSYVLAQPFPTTALVTAKTRDQLGDSLRALDLELSASDVEWLRSGT